MGQDIKIHFLGAVGTVTGSKFLISALGKKILIDCGMFQGVKRLRLLNWENLPIQIDDIDIILLTHGHYDHCGYLPRLIKKGFKGQIRATLPTLQIAETILKDSAKIQEEEAEKANKEGYSKHKPAEALYDSEDVENTIKKFNEIEEGKWIELFDEIKVRFNYNGHILGATFIELDIKGKIFVFSGDIGRENDLLLYDPKKPEIADYVFIESTYGDRFHPNDTEEKFVRIINETIKKKGTVIIPSFAVERTQTVVYMLQKMQDDGLIPHIPMYIDSPMGNNVFDIFLKNSSWYKEDAKKYFDEMSNKIKKVTSMRETAKLNNDDTPKIIIAGSGMGTGGRVLTYFENYLGDKLSTILLVGYQSEGTRGRQLMDGIKEIKIHGKYYNVKSRIENIQGLSAHADQNGLIDWLSDIKNTPSKVFVVHGESQASDILRLKIKDTYGWDCLTPSLNEVYEINNC